MHARERERSRRDALSTTHKKRSSISARKTEKLSSMPGTTWESVGDGEDLPYGHLLGRPSRAFQIPDALLGPRGVAGGLHNLALN